MSNGIKGFKGGREGSFLGPQWTGEKYTICGTIYEEIARRMRETLRRMEPTIVFRFEAVEHAGQKLGRELREKPRQHISEQGGVKE